MLYRAMQFWRGITAKGPNQAEQQMLAEELPHLAQKLFYHMHRADQRHSLNVLRTALDIWQREYSENDEVKHLLIRCCLLHDVGRDSNMGPLRKSVAVILAKLFPLGSRKLSKPLADGKNLDKLAVIKTIRQILYNYYRHAWQSRRLLQSIGLTYEAEIIARHHRGQGRNLTTEQQIVLTILKKADSLN